MSHSQELSPTQLAKLRALLEEVDGPNAFWTPRLRKASLSADTCNAIDDLRRLAPVTKQELVDDQATSPPYGSNLTYSLDKYTRFHQTSGTTGKPMPWLDTAESWGNLVGCWEQIYRFAGIGAGDVVAVPFSFGPFIGFWGAFDAASAAGMRAIPLGGLSSEQRLRMIADHGATVVCCTPTYALRLAEVAKNLGFDLRSTSVTSVIVAGEPGGNIPAVRERIMQEWNARVVDHWGMTDVGALATEPMDAVGSLVLLEDDCIAEIVDPETFEPTAEGQVGELLITNLGRAGMPVFRYRTRDLVRAGGVHEASGFLSLDGGIIGRSDDMLTIRGMNVFPSSIEAIVREFDTVAEFRIRVTTKQAMDHLIVEVEPCPSTDGPGLAGLVARRLHDRLHFKAEVVAVDCDSLPRFELKAKRVIREPS